MVPEPFHKTRSKLFFVYIIANALLVCSAFGQSGTAGNGTAACSKGPDKKMSDAMIAQYTGDSPADGLEVYHPHIERILNVAAQIPDHRFYNELMEVLGKHWHMDPRYAYGECPTEEPGFVKKVDVVKVACQTETDVTIDPIQYYGLDPKTCKPPSKPKAKRDQQDFQIDFIVHELLLGAHLKRFVPQATTDKIFLRLRAPSLTAKDLQGLLETTGFFLAYQKPDCSPPQPETIAPVAKAPLDTSVQASQTFALCSESVIRSLVPGQKYTSDQDGQVVKLVMAAFIKYAPKNCESTAQEMMSSFVAGDSIASVTAYPFTSGELHIKIRTRKDDNEISSVCLEPQECADSAYHVNYDMSAAIARVSNSPLSSCNKNPGQTTDGKLSLDDGSCTYQDPMILVGNQAMPIYHDTGDPRDIGSSQPSCTSARGFCSKQGKTLKKVYEAGGGSDQSNAPAAAILDENGKMIGRMSILRHPGSGGTIVQVTCK
jgi:hypothetical protein